MKLKIYVIQISNRSINYQDVRLWYESKEIRDKWVEELSVVANIRKFKDYYTLKEKLGREKLSEVFKAVENITENFYAVKRVEKTHLSAEERELLINEISTLKYLNHPNIVNFKDVFESKRFVWIVMEFVKGGELFKQLSNKNKFPETETKVIVKQILQAIIYLHGIK